MWISGNHQQEVHDLWDIRIVSLLYISYIYMYTNKDPHIKRKCLNIYLYIYIKAPLKKRK